jgi:hypothetical protein
MGTRSSRIHIAILVVSLAARPAAAAGAEIEKEWTTFAGGGASSQFGTLYGVNQSIGWHGSLGVEGQFSASGPMRDYFGLDFYSFAPEKPGTISVPDTLVHAETAKLYMLKAGGRFYASGDRLRPFAEFGVGLGFVDYEFEELSPNGPSGSVAQDLALGLYVGGGAHWRISRSVGAFGEIVFDADASTGFFLVAATARAGLTFSVFTHESVPDYSEAERLPVSYDHIKLQLTLSDQMTGTATGGGTFTVNPDGIVYVTGKRTFQLAAEQVDGVSNHDGKTVLQYHAEGHSKQVTILEKKELRHLLKKSDRLVRVQASIEALIRQRDATK